MTRGIGRHSRMLLGVIFTFAMGYSWLTFNSSPNESKRLNESSTMTDDSPRVDDVRFARP